MLILHLLILHLIATRVLIYDVSPFVRFVRLPDSAHLLRLPCLQLLLLLRQSGTLVHLHDLSASRYRLLIECLVLLYLRLVQDLASQILRWLDLLELRLLLVSRAVR